MAHLRLVLAFTIGGLFVSSHMSVYAKAAVKLNINTKKALIGKIIKLDIVVTARQPASVSWQLCNNYFKQLKQVIILSQKSSELPNARFKYEVAFTCIKPQKIVIQSLPVLITQYGSQNKILTPPVTVNFLADSIPAHILDIKPIVPISNIFILYKIFEFLLFSLIITGIYLIAHKILQKQLNEVSILKKQYQCLQKLKSLETSIRQNDIEADEFINQVSNQLMKFLYLKQTAAKAIKSADIQNKLPFANSEKDITLIHNVIQTGDQIKFRPMEETKTALLAAYIRDVTTIIKCF